MLIATPWSFAGLLGFGNNYSKRGVVELAVAAHFARKALFKFRQIFGWKIFSGRINLGVDFFCELFCGFPLFSFVFGAADKFAQMFQLGILRAVFNLKNRVHGLQNNLLVNEQSLFQQVILLDFAAQVKTQREHAKAKALTTASFSSANIAITERSWTPVALLKFQTSAMLVVSPE